MSQIVHVAYVVEPRLAGWTVVSGHMAAGRFETRREALRLAGRDAAFCRSLGHDVTLFARLRDGRLRAIRMPLRAETVAGAPIGYRGPAAGTRRSSR
jgi:hypothetical protein